MGTIVSITYKPTDVDSRPPDHYARVSLSQAQLIADFGIEGDAKGGHPKRQLNVMSHEMLQELGQSGYNITPGQMGEQIVLDGLDFAKLAVGDRLQFGATACIEITSFRNGCQRFETLQALPKPTASQEHSLGFMARVVTGGPIHIGDNVDVLLTQPQ